MRISDWSSDVCSSDLRYELNFVGGGVVIPFGLFLIGLLRPTLFMREFRFHAALPRGRPFSAYVLGLAFAFGWTPCIGPILGAILTVGAASATVTGGVALLAIYSFCLGVPFLLEIGRASFRERVCPYV